MGGEFERLMQEDTDVASLPVPLYSAARATCPRAPLSPEAERGPGRAITLPMGTSVRCGETCSQTLTPPVGTRLTK